MIFHNYFCLLVNKQIINIDMESNFGNNIAFVAAPVDPI